MYGSAHSYHHGVLTMNDSPERVWVSKNNLSEYEPTKCVIAKVTVCNYDEPSYDTIEYRRSDKIVPDDVLDILKDMYEAFDLLRIEGRDLFPGTADELDMHLPLVKAWLDSLPRENSDG